MTPYARPGVTATAAAGPILTLEAGNAAVHPGHTIATLALVVALPLGAGVLVLARTPLDARAGRAAAAFGPPAAAPFGLYWRARGGAARGFEPGDLGVQAEGFLLQSQDAADPGEVEAVAGQGGDLH